MRVLMLAAENDALPGGKVGGIGDVLRDSAPALARQGQQLQVVTPAYGRFHLQPGGLRLATVTVFFAGKSESLGLYRVPGRKPERGVELLVLDHPLFGTPGNDSIYRDDPPGRPFASDATRFALFGVAVAQALLTGALAWPDVLHLHDWHAGPFALLRSLHPGYRKLRSLPAVYTVHNLALQGIRPLAGDPSSLLQWFPDLDIARAAAVTDPRYPDCVNLARAGINLSDQVHLVSPTYAREVTRPSVPDQGFFGGEGLELDLQRAHADGRLQGILNGCDYAITSDQPAPPFSQLLDQAEQELLALIASGPVVASNHALALRRLDAWRAAGTRPKLLLTSVGRLTDQKALILRQPMADGRLAIDHLLAGLGSDGALIMLGSGAADLELLFTQVAARHGNFLFIRGYAESLSASLYRCGDLFLMPSSFEPCGISQMLAMRDGQPCLVHAVGGLIDTVQDGVTGFHFSGDNLASQAQAMLTRMDQVRRLHSRGGTAWQKIRDAAATSRFTWQDAAGQYIQQLYQPARGQ